MSYGLGTKPVGAARIDFLGNEGLTSISYRASWISVLLRKLSPLLVDSEPMAMGRIVVIRQ